MFSICSVTCIFYFQTANTVIPAMCGTFQILIENFCELRRSALEIIFHLYYIYRNRSFSYYFFSEINDLKKFDFTN